MSLDQLNRIGCKVSAKLADISADPLAQIGLLVFCIIWFVARLPVEVLTAALSIMAITLSPMVLNKQNEREAESHRRDIALHAKLDELVRATSEARDEIEGIEDLEEDQIERLKVARTYSVVSGTVKDSSQHIVHEPENFAASRLRHGVAIGPAEQYPPPAVAKANKKARTRRAVLNVGY